HFQSSHPTYSYYLPFTSLPEEINPLFNTSSSFSSGYDSLHTSCEQCLSPIFSQNDRKACYFSTPQSCLYPSILNSTEHLTTSDYDNSSSSPIKRTKYSKLTLIDQRHAANNRERKRMETLNEAFDHLKDLLPIQVGKKRRRMSRMDIVSGAIAYIQQLQKLVVDN
ncbi:unnamed protein product, partial [Didymodactylos carnosus]